MSRPVPLTRPTHYELIAVPLLAGCGKRPPLTAEERQQLAPGLLQLKGDELFADVLSSLHGLLDSCAAFLAHDGQGWHCDPPTQPSDPVIRWQDVREMVRTLHGVLCWARLDLTAEVPSGVVEALYWSHDIDVHGRRITPDDQDDDQQHNGEHDADAPAVVIKSLSPCDR